MSDSTEELCSVMNRQHDLFERMETLLKNEFSALTGRDMDRLAQCGAERAPLLAQIEALEREFIRLAGPAAPSGSFFEGVIARTPQRDQARITQTWNALRAVAERCRAQNEINGRIILRNRINAESLLRLIRGGEPGGPASYSSDGRAGDSHSSATIATA